MKKNKKFVFSLVFILSLFFAFNAAFAGYNYTPSEVSNIPGSGATDDFPTYVENIFTFAIWAIGIAAMLMISIGGFMYFASAGNTSKLGKAKEVIRDAIFGLIVVLFAYVLLYVINPDLVNINLDSLRDLRQTSGSGGGGGF